MNYDRKEGKHKEYVCICLYLYAVQLGERLSLNVYTPELLMKYKDYWGSIAWFCSSYSFLGFVLFGFCSSSS